MTPIAIPPGLDEFSLRDRVQAALREDLGDVGDVTTNAVFDEHALGEARIIAKQDAVMAGGFMVRLVFEELGRMEEEWGLVELTAKASDRDHVTNGQTVFELQGSMRTLLAGERLALNFLQHLGGVATATARLVEALRGRVQVSDTRKTTPLWRDVEKYAVRCGGGVNHRMGLYDMAMLKDTHADGPPGGLDEALRRVSVVKPRVKVACEARTLEEVDIALRHGVDLLMLDNMDATTIKLAVARVSGRAITEVTGGVTAENANQLADLGIDRVSSGALTHSVKAVDFSMRLTRT